MEKIETEEMKEMKKSIRNQYPVHHVPDDAQPVEAALDPVDRLLLAQVVAEVTQVAVQEDLPLSLRLNHHLPLLLLLLGSHIVELFLWAHSRRRSGGTRSPGWCWTLHDSLTFTLTFTLCCCFDYFHIF